MYLKINIALPNIAYHLKIYLQEFMNDPDSFEPDKLLVEWNTESSFFVTMSYRGKNAYGGVVLNKASAIIDIDGNVSDFKQLD